MMEEQELFALVASLYFRTRNVTIQKLPRIFFIICDDKSWVDKQFVHLVKEFSGEIATLKFRDTYIKLDSQVSDNIANIRESHTVYWMTPDNFNSYFDTSNYGLVEIPDYWIVNTTDKLVHHTMKKTSVKPECNEKNKFLSSAPRLGGDIFISA